MSDIPNPADCTIDGTRTCISLIPWEHLDWCRAKKHERTLLHLFNPSAPPDPHWAVPHVYDDTVHRVRLAAENERVFWAALDAAIGAALAAGMLKGDVIGDLEDTAAYLGLAEGAE